MNKISIIIGATALLTGLAACKDNKGSFDASGSFEAVETIISSEATGTIQQFRIEEGQMLEAGQDVGYIDSFQLQLKKKQLEAQITAILGKKPNIGIQLSALQEQLKTTEKERTRVFNLVKGDAATSKQLDDVNAAIEVLKKQIAAQQSTLSITSESLNKDILPLQHQVEQLSDQLAKCKIINPIKGTVLAKYVEAKEMTTIGKPLYKIADLSSLILRAYLTSNQLALLKLNQSVKVLSDDGHGGYKETLGTLTWINDKAEFTPKTIQTKDERANMVYAVKIKVINDGSYRIGMYGEIKFQ